MKAYLDTEIARGAYSSISELVRDLVRRKQRRTARDELERKLLEGLESGDPVLVNEEYWEKLHARVHRKIDKKGKPGDA
jgi:antitoxin ParD1/3/4